MNIALQVIEGLLALFSIADKFGINLAAVQATFTKAREEGRDVTKGEIELMAAQASQSGKNLQDLIDQLPSK